MLLYFRTVTCMILRIQMILEPKSPQCNLHGAFDPCGTCKCEPDYYGDKCECEVGYRIPDHESALAACTQPGTTTPCNERGDCKCGYCECSNIGGNITDRYYGQYCECEDYSCPKHGDQLCGGHGSCFCGKCECDDDFTGDACDTEIEMKKYTGGGLHNNCWSAISCEQCFETDPNCGWYKHMDLPNGVSRCDFYNNHLANGISADDILANISRTELLATVERQSEQCYGNGDINMCNQCLCNVGYYGKQCECEAYPDITEEEMTNICINPNSTTKVVCSGRGECICGMCNCFPRRTHSTTKYSGQYCQCDDFSCSYYNNKICGGHGQCYCGVCACDPGYTGEACECPTTSETCVSDNGQICNGQGTCVCGQCRCTGEFKGPFCEQCPTCPGVCQTYKNCALCKLGSGDYTPEECQIKCHMPNIHLVSALNYRDEFLCLYNIGGRLEFTYSYDDNNHIVIKVLARN